MRKAHSLFLFMFLAAPLAHADPVHQAAEERFAQANKQYEQGNIGEALEGYLQLVKQGFSGSALHYNLGNAYYKRGERGRAALWYERALRDAPRDADIRFNLELSRAHLKDPKGSIWDRIVMSFTVGELAVALTLFVWLFFGLWGARAFGWLRAETWSTAVGFTAGAGLLVVGFWFGANVYLSEQPMGVVLAPPGEVRNGPGTDYAVGFTVPEGSRVLVLAIRPDWIQIGIPEQGLKGWMPASDVEQVNARRA